MYFYQLVIIAFLIVAVVATRKDGEVLSIAAFHLFSIAMYYFISSENYNNYYIVMCFLSLSVGLMLSQRFFVAAMCSYALVLVNLVGYLLWYKHYPHHLYDFLSAIILVIQFIFILPKVILNGIDTTIDRYSMVSGCRFNDHKEYATMHKKPQTQEDKK